MSLEQGLRQAILEDPDSDVHRLVFADWLEERGDADRSAFIRTQVRLAQLDWRSIPPGVERFPGEQGVLQRQTDELWRHSKEKWLAELPKYLRHGRVRFHRGFAEELCGAPNHLLKVSASVWARHPIRDLTIQSGPGELARVLALPQLSRVRKLSLKAPQDEESLAALAAADSLAHVRVMSFMSGNGDPAYDALARCPSLRGLSDLFLCAGLRNVTPDGLAALTASDNVAGLVALRLDMIYLKEHSALVVARSPRLAGLKLLSINGRIGDAGARALCESPHLSGLERLELSSFDSISAASCAALRERFGAALRSRRQAEAIDPGVERG